MHQISVKWTSDEHQMPSDNTDSTYLIMESIHYWSHFIGFILWGVNFLESLYSRVRILGFFKQFKHTYYLAYLFSHHPIYKSLKGQMKMSKVLFTSSPFCVRSPLIGDQNRGEDLKCHWDFSTATELLPPPLWFFRVSKWPNSVKIAQSQK